MGRHRRVPPPGPGVFSIGAVSYGTSFVAVVSAALLTWTDSRCAFSAGAATACRPRSPVRPGRLEEICERAHRIVAQQSSKKFRSPGSARKTVPG
ncbi:hypothetical protein NDU88_006183 [Pleurodeles waltl]|uniref:Uncharacterized protein n=1 Tax=Pleurodeles waltl TaxID=8319 RepID=A0AAV7QL74_PLEWA|nr:hypothetical protein NDU88_006183 [Pleurodeles waltl]